MTEAKLIYTACAASAALVKTAGRMCCMPLHSTLTRPPLLSPKPFLQLPGGAGGHLGRDLQVHGRQQGHV